VGPGWLAVSEQGSRPAGGESIGQTVPNAVRGAALTCSTPFLPMSATSDSETKPATQGGRIARIVAPLEAVAAAFMDKR